ncbi:hypothetical protein IEQ34_018657 [Dendrobium chrysotoxum]|uniref:Single-stranded DNA binding protein Ssb-like OB fold domain-containing protein n=1 Tax=Dendrobium chrysotoxum TaxID=161865 RepID=A0AAV7G6F5_DENCH|nr:hypothetical protein IEQ34_018657 [Dendrobium chrysotoxum]
MELGFPRLMVRLASSDDFGMQEAALGVTVILRNAKINMFKGSMRLTVDKWGCVEVTEPAIFSIKVDNNLSLV